MLTANKKKQIYQISSRLHLNLHGCLPHSLMFTLGIAYMNMLNAPLPSFPPLFLPRESGNCASELAFGN